ncbi:MAG TPA: SLATT domain-containing protein [Bryobacteraceae bacterium]|nr:SLATT domain-containing protein [Bryobacteraceae bacterium]
MASNDIGPAGPEGLAWESRDPAGSLDRILRYVETSAQQSIDWYWSKKRWKAVFSRLILLSVVLLLSITAVGPIVGQIFPPLRSLTNGLWATFLVGLAAALLAIDKTFDISSGWKRYAMAATNIRKALGEFRMEWISTVAKAGDDLTAERLDALLLRARQFHSAVETMVLQETKEWVTQFESSLARLDKDVSATGRKH